jgi:hypothetical protein
MYGGNAALSGTDPPLSDGALRLCRAAHSFWCSMWARGSTYTSAFFRGESVGKLNSAGHAWRHSEST